MIVIRRKLKSLFNLLLAVLILALIAVNGLLVWVATGPRSLNDVSPYVERALSQEGVYRVRIDQTWLVWDGWRHPIDIRLRNVSITTAANEEFSTFPEISLGIDLLALITGNILPTSLTVNKPVISLLQNPDKSISFGFKPQAVADALPEAYASPVATGKVVPFGAVLLPIITPDDSSNLRKLRYISIRDADITVGSNEKGVFFNASKTNVTFRRNRMGSIRAEILGDILYGEYHTPVDATLEFNNEIIESDISFTGLMPGTLSELFSDNPHLKQFSVPLSGKLNINMNRDGHLNRMTYVIDGNKGTVSNEYLDAPLEIASMHAKGVISNELRDFQIDEFAANVAGSDISASGVVSLANNNDASIRLQADIKAVDAANVHLFWPARLAPKTREWVVTNITAGRVPLAEVSVNIGFGELALPTLPKQSIDANIQLEDADIIYLPEHPQAEKIKATIHVDGMALEANIESAQYMQDTKLSGGRVYIADLNPDNPYIEVSFDAQSSATDIVKFLSLPRLKKADRLGLREKEAKGSVKGSAKVGFYFFAPLDANGNPGEPEINYDVKADIIDASQPQFMGKFDISAIKGALTINNQSLDFKGSGTVNGANVSDTVVTYRFEPKEGADSQYDTFIDVTATAPVEVLPRFGYPAFEFLSGTLGVKASVKQGADIETATASLDLGSSVINGAGLPWSKKAGEPAIFDISTEKKAGTLTIPSFTLKGADVDARGNASLTADLSGIRSVQMNKLRLGETNLDSLSYEAISGGHKISIKGLVADVSSWVDTQPDVKTEPTFSFVNFPVLQLKADVKRLIMRKQHILNDVKAEVDCGSDICKFANISGTTADEKPFSFRILKNPKGVRQLAMNADSAGYFLGSLNLIDDMDGGTLTLTGNYDDSVTPSSLKGRAYITQYSAKNVPILAKLLTLASFSGIIDTLQGNGIQFDKLSAPFTLSNDVLKLENAKTFGSAIGLTADGTITFPKRNLNIEGTVVPSYTLNNVLGRVPLVGQILTGGEGQGVFAARYSITGNSTEPSVMVNPLSILTPGFLRGLFDILDAPDSGGDDKEPKKTPETNKP